MPGSLCPESAPPLEGVEHEGHGQHSQEHPRGLEAVAGFDFPVEDGEQDGCQNHGHGVLHIGMAVVGILHQVSGGARSLKARGEKEEQHQANEGLQVEEDHGDESGEAQGLGEAAALAEHRDQQGDDEDSRGQEDEIGKAAVGAEHQGEIHCLKVWANIDEKSHSGRSGIEGLMKGFC